MAQNNITTLKGNSSWLFEDGFEEDTEIKSPTRKLFWNYKKEGRREKKSIKQHRDSHLPSPKAIKGLKKASKHNNSNYALEYHQSQTGDSNDMSTKVVSSSMSVSRDQTTSVDDRGENFSLTLNNSENRDRNTPIEDYIEALDEIIAIVKEQRKHRQLQTANFEKSCLELSDMKHFFNIIEPAKAEIKMLNQQLTDLSASCAELRKKEVELEKQDLCSTCNSFMRFASTYCLLLLAVFYFLVCFFGNDPGPSGNTLNFLSNLF